MTATSTAQRPQIRTDLAYGVWSPALTPVTEDLSVDHHRLARHVEWLLGQGCHGVAIMGTTGEATSFSVDERRELLDRLLANGLPAERLMVGTGCCALTDTVTLTRHALASGCPHVLMLPPFYYKGVSDQGLVASYAEVIERVGDDRLRIYFYHFPRLSGVPITQGVIAGLLERYPDVVSGLKDSSGNWDDTRALIERFPGLAIFPGSEPRLLDALRLGGAGCISASANANARGMRRVYDQWASGASEVDETQARATRIRTAIEAHPLGPALKGIVAHHRGDPAWRRVRPPLVSLGDAPLAALVEELEGLGFEL